MMRIDWSSVFCMHNAQTTDNSLATARSSQRASSQVEDEGERENGGLFARRESHVAIPKLVCLFPSLLVGCDVANYHQSQKVKTSRRP